MKMLLLLSHNGSSYQGREIDERICARFRGEDKAARQMNDHAHDSEDGTYRSFTINSWDWKCNRKAISSCAVNLPLVSVIHMSFNRVPGIIILNESYERLGKHRPISQAFMSGHIAYGNKEDDQNESKGSIWLADQTPTHLPSNSDSRPLMLELDRVL
jgi:hypothetical protein